MPVRPVYRPDPPLSREMKDHVEHMPEDGPKVVTNLAELNKALKSNIRLSPESARAVPTSPAPIGESLHMVTKQLLQSPVATDMVITDVRTPPKIKSQITRVNDEYDIVGKGEAIPITLDDHDAYEIVQSVEPQQQNTATKNPISTPPTTASGISTWILLSNSDSTTQAVGQRKSQNPTAASLQQANTKNNSNKKKPSKPIPDTEANSNSSMTTSEIIKDSSSDLTAKPERKQAGTNNKQNANAATKKTPQTSNNKDEIKTPVTINLQDSKFKNRQPVIMGRVPTTSTSVTTTNKTENWNNNTNNTSNIINKKKVTTPSTTRPPQQTLEVKIETNTIAAIVPTRRRPSPQTIVEVHTTSTNPSPSTSYPVTQPTPISTKRAPVYHAAVPTTSVILETESADPDEAEEITTEDAVMTTKRPRRPSQKKKKKPANSTSNTNKRRRRPATKDSEDDSTVLESKITEESNATKTSTPNRPLSTRIYNYLAREVMPSVGVGVVGLLLTAGLAGLFLYPFGGGVAARRTSYESTKNTLPSPDSHMYYYNEYSSKNDVDNAQAEESVFGQMLSGMTQAESQYESRPNTYDNKNVNSNKNNNNAGNKNNNANNNSNNNNNNNNNNNSNNNKYRYDGTTGHHTASNVASIIYPSNKDSQKFSPVINANEQTSNPSRMQDTAAGYSTLTDLSVGGTNHNDRNYPSLTTDTVNDSQYSGSKYSSEVVSGSTGSSYTSSGSASKNSVSGIYNSVATGSPQYSSLIGSPSLTAQNSNNPSSYSSLIGTSATNNQNSNLSPQYSSLIGSSSQTNSQNGNINPSYSSIISSPSVSLTGSNSNPQYQSLVGGSSANSQGSSTGSQYSSMIGSSSPNTQYSSSILMETPGSNHYSKTATSLTSLSNNAHQYSTRLTSMDEHNSGSQYSTLTGISSDSNDNPNKYPSLTTQSHHQNKYQSSGEYAAYNNPSEIGTQGVIGYGSSSDSSTIDRTGDNHRTEVDEDDSNSAQSSSQSAASSNSWKEMEFSVADKEIMMKEEDKSDKSQPQFAALHSSQYMSLTPSRTDQSSFPSNIDMISITGGSNFNPASPTSSSSSSNSGSISSLTAGERHRPTPLASIEHGPRYFRLTQRRKKRQVEKIASTESSESTSQSLNEIDGELPKDDPSDIYLNKDNGKNSTDESTVIVTTTTDKVQSDSTEPTTEAISTTTFFETTTVESDDNSTDNSSSSMLENIEEPFKDIEPPKPQQDEDFTFLGFVRRLAQFKLKLGLSFLRSTSQAVSKYFQSVQQRMERVVRRLEKRARSYERQRNSKVSGNNKTINRNKRSTEYLERKLKRKKMNNKKKST